MRRDIDSASVFRKSNNSIESANHVFSFKILLNFLDSKTNVIPLITNLTNAGAGIQCFHCIHGFHTGLNIFNLPETPSCLL